MDRPGVDLGTLFLSLFSAACIALGIAPDEDGICVVKPDFDRAQHSIEMLELLQAKTAGNRSPDEDHLIDRLLYEIRMQYIALRQNAGP